MNGCTSSFGELLRQLRTNAALSQEELAELAGLSLRGVSDLERGARRTPHLSTVGMLAEALAPSRRSRARATQSTAGPWRR
jgi:transcriptional regulator with XRE-family HTH domain